MKLTGEILKRLFDLNVDHSLYKKDGGWYHYLKKIPGVLFDRNGYAILKLKMIAAVIHFLQFEKT